MEKPVSFLKKGKYNFYIEKIKIFFNEQAYKLYINKLHRLRFICVLICLDFIALVSLSGASLNQFLNPLQFLERPATDRRDVLVLYYLPTFGVGSSNDQIKNLIPVQRRVHQFKEGHPEHILRENAKLIIQELRYEPDSLKAKKVIKDNGLVKYIWVWDRTLIVHFNGSKWSKIPEKNRLLIQNSIKKSIIKNLNVQKIVWSVKS